MTAKFGAARWCWRSRGHGLGGRSWPQWSGYSGFRRDSCSSWTNNFEQFRNLPAQLRRPAVHLHLELGDATVQASFHCRNLLVDVLRRLRCVELILRHTMRIEQW